MGEVACAGAVEYLIVHTDGIKEFGQDDAAHAVDGIDADAELAALDGLDVGELQLKHAVDMTQVKRKVLNIVSQLVDLGIVEVLACSDVEHLGTVGRRQEFALAIQQFQGIPLTRIVRGGDDDAAVGTAHADSQFGSGCGGEADVDHVASATHEGSADHILHHLARDAAVATYNDLQTGISGFPGDKLCVGGGELNDV